MKQPKRNRLKKPHWVKLINYFRKKQTVGIDTSEESHVFIVLSEQLWTSSETEGNISIIPDMTVWKSKYLVRTFKYRNQHLDTLQG